VSALQPLLVVRGLCKRFGGVVATDDVGLEVATGEIHALIGPNGAGKTSLIAQLAGSVAPDAGSIVFAGRDVTRLSQHARVSLGLARSFQITRLFKGFTALENLALAVQARSGSSLSFWRPAARESRLADAARELLADLGLEARADVPAEHLAHGEQRALEVGLALATRPRLLLLDEPFAALDEITRQQLDDQLRALWRATGMTVLFVTHSIAEAAFLAERAVVLTRRPARVVLEHRIDLPSERDAALRGDPRFARETRVLYEALARGNGDAP
jgi:branched-chain amino acid transport system ATP-binding protein